MKPTFGFFKTLPSPGPWIVARLNGRGAVRASDAGVVLVMENVVGHVMRFDVGPDLIVGPGRKGIELDETERGVPFNHARGCARR